MGLIDYGQKVVTLIGSLDRLTDKVTAQGEDSERLRAATTKVTQFATSLRDRAVDFRQRSDERYERHEQDIRGLQSQVAALAATLNELSADLKKSQETAVLKEELHLEKMKNSLNDIENRLCSQFFQQVPRILSDDQSAPTLPVADDSLDTNKPAR